MYVITAVEPVPKLKVLPTVFLAGGITNCPDWQAVVISGLSSVNGVLFNPRRPNFPIDVPSAAETERQIAWEFDALQAADIFSMWFCNANSDQPICMYELGRHVARYQQMGQLARVVVGVEPGYRRATDVRIQLRLVNAVLAQRITSTLDEHIDQIHAALLVMAREREQKYGSCNVEESFDG